MSDKVESKVSILQRENVEWREGEGEERERRGSTVADSSSPQ